MDILDRKTDHELQLSLLAELAKAQNEIAHAVADLDKARSRQRFCLVLINKLIERQEIER